MALSSNAIESMLQAMDIIAGYKLNDVSYDRTVICTIVDNSDAKNGRYTVTDGTIKFQAFSEAQNYKINEQVRVSIPNGDYTEQKYIEGKYVPEDSVTPITYVSPLESVIEMANLTSGGTQQSIQEGLTANKVDVARPNGIPIWTWSASENQEFKDLQANGIYNTLSLQADFKCLLGSKRIRSGTYGLRIDMEVRANSVNDKHILKSLYLDSSEMFGNPYSFTIYSTQAKKFDIEHTGVIDRMTLYFFQNNDFTYYDGKSTVAFPVEAYPNIFVKNIYLGFGSDVTEITDNTIQLYTGNDLNFRYILPADSTNQKEIGFLWYNKTQDNQYIGFSDGIVDLDEQGQVIPYDEIAYLEESEENARLVSQMGKNIPTDKLGLDLSARVEEALPILTQTSRLLTQDLSNALKAFRERLSGIPAADIFAEIIKTTLPNIADALEESQDNLKQYFTDALSYAAILQKDQKDGTENYKNLTQPISKNYFTFVKDKFKELDGLLYSLDESEARITFVEDILQDIQEKYQGFQGVYDTYKIRVDKIYALLDENLFRLTELLEKQEDLADDYNINSPIVDYIQKDFSVYDNRYCVYWYRYKPGYYNKDERFMDKEWERIETVPNLGLPSGYTVDGDIYYWNPKPLNSEGLLQVFLTPEMVEEKFMVVLFYNHEMYKSGELKFTNLDTVPDPTTVDKSDAIYIEHGLNSMESYQTLYGSNNSLLNSADARKIRELKIRYDGLLHGDEALAGGRVYWYVPLNSTMIQVDADDLQKRGFSTDYYRTVRVTAEAPTYEGPKDSYQSKGTIAADEVIYVYEQVNGFYSINKNNKIGTSGKWIHKDDIEFIDSEYHRDGYACFYKQISAVEVESTEQDEDGNPITITTTTCKDEDTYFYYKIKDYYVPTSLKNTIFCKIEKDEYPFETDISLLFGTQGTSGTDYTLIVTPSGSQTAVTNTNSLPLNVILYDYNNEKMNMYSKYKDNTGANDGNLSDLIVSAGTAFDARVEWMGPTAFSLYLTTDPEDYSVTGGEATLIREDENYCGIAKVITSFGLSDNGQEETESTDKHYRIVDLTTLYPVAWSAGDYYIEGATSIIYDSSGVNPAYYKDPYRIFYNNTNEEIFDVRWEIKLFAGENGKTAALLTSGPEYDFYKKYMPVINDKGGLTPSNMYIDGVECYPVVYCYDSDDVLIWAQPLVIIQNRYPSAMLNQWDGSLTIDEKNGTIMSAMVGAGRKTSDNTFEGVLMGDIEGGADMDLTENKTGLGLYGFNDGAQSFGFNVDGTAFIGKSGRGRIKFDGENGTISSASYEQLKNTGDSGMKIDLDDGTIDFYGTAIDATNDNGSNTYKLDGYHSHIRFSANASEGNPYMLVTTPNRQKIDEWIAKPLLYIGLDNYFLQSENYAESTFNPEDGEASEWGRGMHINLQDGRLDAYNLLITSKNIFIDSSENADPFFIVKDNDGCNLIYVGTNNFYIQSHSYSQYLRGITNEDGTYNPGIRMNLASDNSSVLMDIRGKKQPLLYITPSSYYLQSDDYTAPENSDDGYGHGMRVNLSNGRIVGYNFSLKGENSDASKTQYNGSYIQMTSNPLFRVHLKDSTNDYDLDLINISPTRFFLNSKNWNSNTSTSSSTVYMAKVTVTNVLNVRSGPGTNYEIVGSLSAGDELQVYGPSVNGWWSLDSSKNQGSGQWAYEGDSKEYMTVTSTSVSTDSGTAAGMQLNVYNGSMVMNKDESRQLCIDVTQGTYPLQLGKKISGKSYRNFRVSWDGAIYGGSTYSWSIAADGTAKFNKMNANSGTLNYMNLGNVTISSGKIGGCTIKSGGISGSGWSLTASGASFNSLTVGGYEFTPTTLRTNNTYIQTSYPAGESGWTAIVRSLTYTPITLTDGTQLKVATGIESAYIKTVSGEYRVVGTQIK